MAFDASYITGLINSAGGLATGILGGLNTQKQIDNQIKAIEMGDDLSQCKFEMSLEMCETMLNHKLKEEWAGKEIENLNSIATNLTDPRETYPNQSKESKE